MGLAVVMKLKVDTDHAKGWTKEPSPKGCVLTASTCLLLGAGTPLGGMRKNTTQEL